MVDPGKYKYKYVLHAFEGFSLEKYLKKSLDNALRPPTN